MNTNTCPLCKKTFTQYKNLKRHILSKHNGKVDITFPSKKHLKTYSFKCKLCPRQFSSEKNFKAHNKIHSPQVNTRKVKCPLCKNNVIKLEFEEHVNDVHGLQFSSEILHFASHEDFISWKTDLEEDTSIAYVKVSGMKRAADSSRKAVFSCHRSGHYSPSGRGLRKLKSQGSKKIDAYCPAGMRLVIKDNSECTVTFMKTHLGHTESELCHVTPTRDVLAANDHVLFYKPRGAVSETYPALTSEDFMLIIMNGVQREMLKKFSSDCVCIDGTHGHGLELVTLMVTDNLRQDFPCAFLITNRTDRAALTVFFSSVRRSAGTLTPRVFVSDMAESFHSAWVSSMNVPEKRLFYTYRVDRAWRKNLSRIESKEKQAEAFGLLRALLDETDRSTFDILIEEVIQHFLNDSDTREFGRYFQDNFLENVKSWASCFRRCCRTNTNMHIENMHKLIQCMYLNGENVKSLDKCIDTLMSYVKNKLLDRLIVLRKGDLSGKIKMVRARHATSLKSDINEVRLTEAGWNVSSLKNRSNYSVRPNDDRCSCKLICTDCNCCVHKYICSCIDNCINCNMCKHIHLVCRYIEKSNISVANKESLSTLQIHTSYNAQALSETKTFSGNQYCSSLQARKETLINNFMQLVNDAATEEDIAAIEKSILHAKI